MLKINLPQNMLEKEQYLALSSWQKGEYIHNLLKEILDLNPKGVTVSQIDKTIYIGRSTIWHHLEILASKGTCFKMDRGDTEVYYPNEVITALKELEVKGELYTYSFSLVKNQYGKFVNIQAKQEDRTGNLAAHSGVLLGSKFFVDIVNSLAKIKDNHLNEDKQK